MALRIVEMFGHAPADPSGAALDLRATAQCPFIRDSCTKQFRDGRRSGVCTVQLARGESPVVCCPNRLYAGDYRILVDVARLAFGEGVRLINGNDVAKVAHDGRNVAVFGKRWGKELRLPRRDAGRGGYFVDWVLALISREGALQEFVALEVQTIDTTGTYRGEWDAYMRGENPVGLSNAGLNWENVSKRILPQLIHKGNVLRRERLCTKGMFFVCPTQVYQAIQGRLSNDLEEYPGPAAGNLTFVWYGLGPEPGAGRVRELVLEGTFSTTIDQVSDALTGAHNLPLAGVYERAIMAELAAH
jgi:hypothetical protein